MAKEVKLVLSTWEATMLVNALELYRKQQMSGPSEAHDTGCLLDYLKEQIDKAFGIQ